MERIEGGLEVHRVARMAAREEFWAVTHVASGWAVMRFLSRDRAERLRSDLLKLRVDWTDAAESVVHRHQGVIRPLVRRYSIEEWGERLR